MKHRKRKPLQGRCVWQGSELQQDLSWQHVWTEPELAEIEQGLQRAHNRGAVWERVTLDDFPLDRVADRLVWAAEELENGRGLVKFTGLPVDRYDESELRLIWMALARYLGRPVFQDSQGQLMRAIRDEGGDLGARPRSPGKG